MTARRLRDLPGICYLCGAALTGDVDDDHVPPKQLHARDVRRAHELNLLTVPTHRVCNHAYQLDEDYFVHSLGPIALGSTSGKAVLKDLFRQYRKGRNVPLSQKVLAEFESRPSGLYLPGEKVVKRFTPDRIQRVVWKITRGLFFHEYRKFVSETTPRRLTMFSSGERPPRQFALLGDRPTKGRYPGIFDYKYAKFPEVQNWHVWALLFWDTIATVVSFHDPECLCHYCTDVRKGSENN